MGVQLCVLACLHARVFACLSVCLFLCVCFSVCLVVYLTDTACLFVCFCVCVCVFVYVSIPVSVSVSVSVPASSAPVFVSVCVSRGAMWLLGACSALAISHPLHSQFLSGKWLLGFRGFCFVSLASAFASFAFPVPLRQVAFSCLWLLRGFLQLLVAFLALAFALSAFPVPLRQVTPWLWQPVSPASVFIILGFLNVYVCVLCMYVVRMQFFEHLGIPLFIRSRLNHCLFHHCGGLPPPAF